MSFRKLFRALLTFGCASIFVVGCTTVDRVPFFWRADYSGRWNDTDSRLVSREMVSEMNDSGWIPRFKLAHQRLPVVIVGDIRNLTSEHIETETFIKDLERELVNSGRVKFVAAKGEREEIRTERKDQQNRATGDTAKAVGKVETGADFMLQGSMKSIIDTEGGRQVRYYQVDLELVAIETTEKTWIGTKKIKKLVQRSPVKW